MLQLFINCMSQVVEETAATIIATGRMKHVEEMITATDSIKGMVISSTGIAFIIVCGIYIDKKSDFLIKKTPTESVHNGKKAIWLGKTEM